MYKTDLNDLQETFGARYQIFKGKVQEILAHNSDPEKTYTKGLN